MRLLLLVALSACAAPDFTGWGERTTVVTPSPGYEHVVSVAIAAWNDRLEVPAFAIGENGYPITEVPEAEWSVPFALGQTDDAGIIIRAGLRDPKILIHELGHAIGLAHRAGPSIMTAEVVDAEVWPDDVTRAVGVLRGDP